MTGLNSNETPLILCALLLVCGLIADVLYPGIWFQRSGALATAGIIFLFAMDRRSNGSAEIEANNNLKGLEEHANSWAERVGRLLQQSKKSDDPHDIPAEEFIEIAELRKQDEAMQSRIVGSNFRTMILSAHRDFETETRPVRRFKRNEAFGLCLSTLVWGFGDFVSGSMAVWS